MDIRQTDKQYVAGTYNRFPVEIVSGSGSIVRDVNGKEYIDMGSGIGVTSFGLCDGVWQQAAIAQLTQLQHMSNLYYTAPCAELARMLCERTGMKKVFFSNSGAEANECAIKAARKYSAEKKGADCFTVVTLKNSFHGRTLTTLAATGQEHYHELYTPLTPGFTSIDAGEIRQLCELAGNVKIAAVMIECIQGEGGVIAIDPDFAREVQRFCTDNDVPLIIDEVQTGNGRTGRLYSYMDYGLTPDIVSTAKGLAGGLPLGATLLGAKVENVLGFGDHGSTFGGNPVCCAAAVSIVKRLDDDLLAEVRRKGDFIRQRLSGAKGVISVSGMGLMVGVETERPAGQLVKELIDRGVLCLTAKHKLRLLPALNIPMPVLEKAVDIIIEQCSADASQQ